MVRLKSPSAAKDRISTPLWGSRELFWLFFVPSNYIEKLLHDPRAGDDDLLIDVFDDIDSAKNRQNF